MPATHLWSKIQKQLHGKTEDEQLHILRGHLEELHDEWKGPYKDLRDRLRRLVARHEGHDVVRSHAGQHDPFHVPRQGDARVVFAGMPNVGKSALVGGLTNAATVVADYPFATLQPMPGMLPCAGGSLQLIDTPPIVPGLASGQGAGRPLLHLLSTADAIAVVFDHTSDPVDQVESVFAELAETLMHPVPGPLATRLHIRGKGGVRFQGKPPSREEAAAARAILAAADIEHGSVTVHTSFDEAILQKQVDGETPMPTVLIGTGVEAGEEISSTGWPAFRHLWVDAGVPASFTSVPDIFLEILGLVGVGILERPSADADRTELLVYQASNIMQVAERAGASLKRLKGARVWGRSVPRPGQTVSLEHLVEVGDRIYLQS